MSALARICLRRLWAAGVLACSLAGCASYSTASDSSYRFASEVPAGVSSAWRQGEAVWLVPQRNTLITTATDDRGASVPIETVGSYLRLASASGSFTLKVNENTVVRLTVPKG